MTAEAELHVRNAGFGGKVLTLASNSQKWNQLQLWKSIKQIVESNEVRYDVLLFNTFNGDNEALKALVREKILSVKTMDGVKMVTAFSQLYMRAFQQLVLQSPELARGLNILDKKQDIAKD